MQWNSKKIIPHVYLIVFVNNYPFRRVVDIKQIFSPIITIIINLTRITSIKTFMKIANLTTQNYEITHIKNY